jgi:hypothetical protein
VKGKNISGKAELTFRGTQMDKPDVANDRRRITRVMIL